MLKRTGVRFTIHQWGAREWSVLVAMVSSISHAGCAQVIGLEDFPEDQCKFVNACEKSSSEPQSSSSGNISVNLTGRDPICFRVPAVFRDYLVYCALGY